MIPGSIRMEFQSRSFDFVPEPSTRCQVGITERWPVDAALGSRTDGCQFIKGGKHTIGIDVKIICHVFFLA
jgi:hypothetical protein